MTVGSRWWGPMCLMLGLALVVGRIASGETFPPVPSATIASEVAQVALAPRPERRAVRYQRRQGAVAVVPVVPRAVRVVPVPVVPGLRVRPIPPMTRIQQVPVVVAPLPQPSVVATQPPLVQVTGWQSPRGYFYRANYESAVMPKFYPAGSEGAVKTLEVESLETPSGESPLGPESWSELPAETIPAPPAEEVW